MRLQLDSNLFIEYEQFMGKCNMVHIFQAVTLSNMRLVIDYGARDGENIDEGKLHLVEHYLDSYFQKKLFSKGVFVVSQTKKEYIKFDFTFNSSYIAIKEIYDVILEVFSEGSISDRILETEQMRIRNEIGEFKIKPDLIIEEQVDKKIWIGGLSKTIRGDNPYLFTSDKIIDLLNILSMSNVAIIFAGNYDKDYFFEDTRLFYNNFYKSKKSNCILRDGRNIFIPYSNIINCPPVGEKVYISYGKTSSYVIPYEETSQWILLSTLLAGHRNSLLPQLLMENENFVYSIYSIPSKYRYENIIKIKCVCDSKNIDEVISIIQKTYSNINDLIDASDVEYSRTILEHYILETFLNNARLMNFIEDIVLSGGDNDDFLDIAEKSIELTKRLGLVNFQEFVNRFLMNSEEYIHSEIITRRQEV